MEGAAGKGQSETGLTNGGGIVTDAPAVLQHIDKLEFESLFYTQRLEYSFLRRGVKDNAERPHQIRRHSSKIRS